MTAGMTYQSLVLQLQTWLERVGDTQFIAQIPTIIAQAEVMLCREYKGLGTKQTVNLTFDQNDPVMPWPASCREMVHICYGVGTTPGTIGSKRVFLKKRSLEFCQSFWPDLTQSDPVNFPPRYYADYQWGFTLIVPTPALQYPAELQFHERPQPLDDQNSSNWFTQYAPDLLFKACKKWANTFVRKAPDQDDDVDFARALASSMGEDQGRMQDAAQDPHKGA